MEMRAAVRDFMGMKAEAGNFMGIEASDRRE